VQCTQKKTFRIVPIEIHVAIEFDSKTMPNRKYSQRKCSRLHNRNIFSSQEATSKRSSDIFKFASFSSQSSPRRSRHACPLIRTHVGDVLVLVATGEGEFQILLPRKRLLRSVVPIPSHFPLLTAPLISHISLPRLPANNSFPEMRNSISKCSKISEIV